MKNLYISKDADEHLKHYLEGLGFRLEIIESDGVVDRGISNHPDIFLCKLGISEDSPIYFAGDGDLGYDYPEDSAFNAACTGRYFIHKFSCTNKRLYRAAVDAGMEMINVRQGYTKCSIVIVDENAIITYDEGIAKACSAFPDLDVLRISPGFVRLDGYDTGFIGGCSGRVGNEIIFNGNLAAHPDFFNIVDFVEKHGLTCRWFDDYPLTDIGSIL